MQSFGQRHEDGYLTSRPPMLLTRTNGFTLWKGQREITGGMGRTKAGLLGWHGSTASFPFATTQPIEFVSLSTSEQLGRKKHPTQKLGNEDDCNDDEQKLWIRILSEPKKKLDEGRGLLKNPRFS